MFNKKFFMVDETASEDQSTKRDPNDLWAGYSEEEKDKFRKEVATLSDEDKVNYVLNQFTKIKIDFSSKDAFNGWAYAQLGFAKLIVAAEAINPNDKGLKMVKESMWSALAMLYDQSNDPDYAARPKGEDAARRVKKLIKELGL